MTITAVPSLTNEDRTAPARNGAGRVDERQPTSWVPLDLTAALSGQGVPAPDLLPREDGACLVYRGRVHWFQGEPESCKSWLAIFVCVLVALAGGTVLYIDYEDDETGFVERLRALGLTAEQIMAHIIYIRPEEPLVNSHGQATAGQVDFGLTLEARQPIDLVVIDGVTEAMTTEDLDLLSNADIATWMRRLPKRLAGTGPAVICVDHVTKSREGRGGWAIGGQHKKAGVTGAAYSFDVVEPFGRNLTGRIRVMVDKDRPGHVRSIQAADRQVAVMTLQSWPDGGVTVHLEPPGAGTPSATVVERITEHLTTYPGTTKTQLRELGNSGHIDEALRWLTGPAGANQVRVEAKGNAHRHYLADPIEDDEF